MFVLPLNSNREDEDVNLIEKVQKLAIVTPEVVTGRHHPAPGRVRAAELIRRETVVRRPSPRPVKFNA